MRRTRLTAAAFLTIVFFVASVLTHPLCAQAHPVRMEDGTVFDAVYYAERYPDLAAAFGNDANLLWQHFRLNGRAEGRQCTRFDYRYYAETYPDLMEAFGYDEQALWGHYLRHGMQEGRYAHLGQQIGDYISTAVGVSALSATKGAGSEKPVVLTQGGDPAAYYGTTLLIGDSVLAGYGMVCAASPEPLTQSFLFMAAPSYSVTHALNENEGGLHPPYRGRRLPPWEVVADLQPQTVFLSFGINDLTYTAPETLLEKYTLLVTKIHDAHPSARIVILSTTYPYPGVNRVYLNSANVSLLNEGMRAACEANGWVYLDVATPLSDGAGNMRTDVSSDNYVHILPQAYSVFTDVIRAQALTGQ